MSTNRRAISRRHRHRLFGHTQIQAVVGDKQIEHVEIGARAAIHLDDLALLDAQAGRGIVGAVGHDQAGLGPRLDKGLFVDIALGEDREAAGLSHCGDLFASR